MATFKKVTFLCLYLTLGLEIISTYAQESDFKPLNIEVIESGDTLSMPWAGGIFSSHLGQVDINNDGRLDLVSVDRYSSKNYVFIHEANGTYYLDEALSLTLPKINGWFYFRDVNCDGVSDLFCYEENNEGSYYQGTYIDNTLQFIFSQETITVDGNPLFTQFNDNPILEDIDLDGDIDLLTYDAVGQYLQFYKNQSLELGQGCGLSFQLSDHCWGAFANEIASDSIVLNQNCLPNLQSPNSNASLHFIPSLFAFDYQGDGDFDLFAGDVLGNSLSLLKNGGSSSSPLITEVIKNFPSYNTPVNLAYNPLPFYLDVDLDGLLDLVISNGTGELTYYSEMEEVLWFYKNMGTNENPVFELQTTQFLINQMIDVGIHPHPVFWDENGDGLLDLLIGNYGEDIDQDFTANGKLVLYRNIGTIDLPVFELIDQDFANIEALNMENIHPTFGDLDQDGDEDLILGQSFGRLEYFENQNGNFIHQGELYDYAGFPVPIDVGQWATPQLVDINSDGLLDLIVGEANGNLNFYQNTGIPTSANFELISNNWGEVDVRNPGEAYSASIPFIKTNQNGNWELYVSNQSGQIFHYNQIENHIAEGAFNLLSSSFGDFNITNRHTGFAFGDLTNNGIDEILIGEFAGGLMLFQESIPTVINHFVKTPLIEIYPNPSNGEFFIDLPEISERLIPCQIYNSFGQLMYEAMITKASPIIDITDFPPGIYFLSIKIKDQLQTVKLLTQN